MATAVVNALNGSAPERTPTINVTSVTYTGLGSNVVDVFVVDGESVGDPVTGGNQVTAKSTPVSAAPFVVFFNGLRQIKDVDYTNNAGVVTLLNGVVFNTANTLVLDYWVASA